MYLDIGIYLHAYYQNVTIKKEKKIIVFWDGGSIIYDTKYY
jgi:hypothetical protein